MGGLQGRADDDHEDAEGADGRGAHEHGTAAGFVEEADAEDGAEHHDGGLEGVHQELLFCGGYAGVLKGRTSLVCENVGRWAKMRKSRRRTYFCHQRHIVGSGRQVQLAEEADAHDEEEAVASGPRAEEIFVVPPLEEGISIR